MKTHRRILSFVMVLMMLVGTLSVFSFNVASASQSSSTITITMSDSYGDGWNGNGIDVYINGVNSGRYTVSSGSSATHNISYDSMNTYEFKWVKGSYSGECSFTIKMGGTVLLSATQTQCGNYSSSYSLLTIESTQESQYDLEGEFEGGTGTTADPYLVATKAQLNNVRKYPNAHFRQVKNIVFTASDFSASGDFYNNGKGWEPIGNSTTSFNGSYDGRGYAIDGLTITADASQTSYIGLFGYAYGDIVNVTLTNINYTVTGYGNVGGIVGKISSYKIIGCSVTGAIHAQNGDVGGIAGDSYKVEHCESNVAIDAVDATVGGIVGWSFGSVRYCKNSGNITLDCDTNTWVGGIVGHTSSEISDCKNYGNITVGGEADIYVVAGGIAGYAYNNISRCENNGTLNSGGATMRIGGIVGEFEQYTISECVNRGNASTVLPAEFSYVGGIVGNIYGGYYSDAAIRDCYVTDTVTIYARGTSQAYGGGICGDVLDSSVTNCYSLVNTVTVTMNSSGWGRGGIAGCSYGTVSACYYRYSYGIGYNGGSSSISRYSSLSSYESQSTYSGFDFTSTWKMGTGTYKYAVLRMESGHTHSLTRYASTVTFESAGNLEHWYCSSCQTYFRNSSGTLYVTTDMLKSDPIPVEGSCGTNVKWKLTPEGELTIWGSGKMSNYTDSASAPWYKYREGVKSVIVKQGVTGIGNNAFKGCTNLTKVTFADSIETIGSSAFSGCSNITQLLVPEGVISVGDNAFSSITSLIVCFEGSAPSFGGTNVFSGTSVTAYYPVDDATWTADIMQGQTGSVTWTAYTSVDDIIIASGTFNGYYYSRSSWKLSFSGILTVTGEYSDEKIRDYSYSSRPAWDAYKDCITSVNLVGISRIGKETFSEYKALKSVNFGSVKEVGSYAFANCSALESVFLSAYYSDVSIGDYAFYDCSSLKQAAFPKDTTIGDYAFSVCSQLNKIYITTYRNYSGTPISATSTSFYGVTATVYVPINWEYLTDYGDFGGNLSWEEAACGPCGPDAFWTYDANTFTVTITGTGSIASYYAGSEYPWYGLRADVTKVVIEDGITYIPPYVFEYMSDIKTVVLPGTLQTLTCNAFNDCKSLNNLVIPASVTEFVSGYYFNRCNSLTDVYYMGTAEEWSNIENNTVVGTSYDYIRNIHYLVLNEQIEATCTMEGSEAYYQFDDTSVYSGYYDLNKQPMDQPETYQALGHDIVYHDGKASNCIEAGYAAYETCTRCDHTTYTDLPIASHNIVNHESKSPTCTEIGWFAYETCEDCDYTTYSELRAYGHTYGNGVCIHCGEEEPVLPGDVNNSGAVDITDLATFRRYLSGATIDGFNEVAADVDGDGFVKISDVSTLARLLA